jgi:hypothetical protein
MCPGGIKMLFKYLYVQVRENQLVVHDTSNPNAVPIQANSSFSSQRLLLANFDTAVASLKELIRRIYSSILPPLFVHVVIHPLEKIEGGLAPVEERALLELAEVAGAWKVVVWTGPTLNGLDVMRKFK